MWKEVENGKFPPKGFYFGLASRIPCIAYSDGKTMIDVVTSIIGNDSIRLTHYMEIPKNEPCVLLSNDEIDRIAYEQAESDYREHWNDEMPDFRKYDAMAVCHYLRGFSRGYWAAMEE